MGYDDYLDFSPLYNNFDKFTICYTGTLNSDYQPWLIFDVLKELILEGYELQLIFVGIVANSIKDYVNSLKLQHTVFFVDYLTHKEAVSFLRKANALLLVSPKVKSENLIIPGKLYEYLAAKKPIINIGNKNSNTAKIITHCEGGVNIGREDIKILKEFLKDWLKKLKTNPDYIPLLSNDNILNFARKKEVKKICRILISNH